MMSSPLSNIDSIREINADYNTLFNHVENLKKVLLVASGRTGSDFFQSLLDGHPEILQFTGKWYFHQFWKEAKCKENLSDLISEFIWHTGTSAHITKFKSFYNKIERWDQLGDKKNDFFEVDIDMFKNYMLNILKGRELNSRNFFLAVNLAYGLATSVDIRKTRILFYHIHHIERLKEFREDFQDFYAICMVREPRNTMVSGLEHWKRYDRSIYNSRFFYEIMKRIFEESQPVLRYTKDVRILKLEDLHLFPREVLGEFCRMYGLSFEESMLKSSYHGKKWWGDALSVEYLDGFNRNINLERWKDKLFPHDNFLIEFILEHRLRHYSYVLKNRISDLSLIQAIFLVFLPMKYELGIFLYNFKNSRNLKMKLIAAKDLGMFYVLRILLYFKFMQQRLIKKTFLADFFGRGAL